MRIKLRGKLLPVVIAVVLLMALVPAVSAYEAHTINVTARVESPATRTYGFWKTHLDYTTHVFNDDYLDGEIDIGWRYIDDISELMGVFWADVEKLSDNSTHRDELCKERVKTAHQALAATLNSALPNGAHMPVTLSYIQSTLSGIDITAIQNLGTTLDNYNNRYDKLPIQDDYPIGDADPQGAQDIADLEFADYCP